MKKNICKSMRKLANKKNTIRQRRENKAKKGERTHGKD